MIFTHTWNNETVLDLYESGDGFEFGIMNDLYYQLFHGYDNPFDS